MKIHSMYVSKGWNNKYHLKIIDIEIEMFVRKILYYLFPSLILRQGQEIKIIRRVNESMSILSRTSI